MAAIAFVLFATLAPFVQNLLKTTTLSGQDWLLVLIATVIGDESMLTITNIISLNTACSSPQRADIKSPTPPNTAPAPTEQRAHFR